MVVKSNQQGMWWQEEVNMNYEQRLSLFSPNQGVIEVQQCPSST